MNVSDNTRIIDGSYRFKVLNKEDELEHFSGKFDSLPEALAWFCSAGREHLQRGHRLVLSCYKPGRDLIIGTEINKDNLKYYKP